ncbi:MAG: DUF6090 family protein [Pseudomonadota bacterium]
MLLRRLTQHVRDQNWTAVILDFVIVVTGVFVGIQLGNWNEARAERKAEISYLTRLHADLSADIEMYDLRLKVINGQLDLAPEALGTSPDDTASAWSLIRAQYAISGILPPEIRDATYTDMVNAGGLALIQDQHLRDRLVNYYVADGALPVLKSEPPFRQMVRGIIPHTMQAYLTSPICAPDFVSYLPCDPPDDLGSVNAVAKTMREDVALMRALNYSIAHHEICRKIILALIANTADLRGIVEVSLAARGVEV